MSLRAAPAALPALQARGWTATKNCSRAEKWGNSQHGLSSACGTSPPFCWRSRWRLLRQLLLAVGRLVGASRHQRRFQRRICFHRRCPRLRRRARGRERQRLLGSDARQALQRRNISQQLGQKLPGVAAGCDRRDVPQRRQPVVDAVSPPLLSCLRTGRRARASAEQRGTRCGSVWRGGSGGTTAVLAL